MVVSVKLWHEDPLVSLFGKGIYLYDMDLLRLFQKSDLVKSRVAFKNFRLKHFLGEMKLQMTFYLHQLIVLGSHDGTILIPGLLCNIPVIYKKPSLA